MLAVNEIGEPLMIRPPSDAKPVVPVGCKGVDCPFFAQCQGRCAAGRNEERPAPDGGVWIETRA